MDNSCSLRKLRGCSFIFLSALVVVLFPGVVVGGGNFNNDVEITWGDGRAKVAESGDQLTLSLDQGSGSGFQSKETYMFGKIAMQMKLVPGNSAGTATTFYLQSEGPEWDEIDFEFLGNVTGQPYLVHTNVYTQGQGSREQQFRLWFDPTADFHNYSVLWNPHTIIFYVENTPIREFPNLEARGVQFPKDKPMRVHSTIFNADDWATRGGLVKTDWSQAPFVASYRNFEANACVWSGGTSTSTPCGSDSEGWFTARMEPEGLQKMGEFQRQFMTYNYCNDHNRFAGGFPPECSVQ
ncbi:hypothetical protein MLD38_014902 [Melastoma candidum]|uniref:Uncharacterized protein n=1 Tax=Melastoma candidum TaxID=119954 RepID=A0ACB9RFN4_9MYRT|nr:hypothetical protein MLD38_014902 [Melastoma candidum]